MTTKTTTTKTRTTRPTTDTTTADVVNALLATNEAHTDAMTAFTDAKEALVSAFKARVEASVQVARVVVVARSGGVLRASAGRVRVAEFLAAESGVSVSADSVRSVVRAVKADGSVFSGEVGSPVGKREFSVMSRVLQDRAQQTDSGKNGRGDKEVSFADLAKRVDKVSGELGKVARGADDRDKLVAAVERLARQLSA